MTFNQIDLNNWKRKEIFHHYINQQTTFSLTREIEMTELYRMTKQKGYRFYPVFIFLVTRVINSNQVFRTSFNHEGELGYWDQLDPMYTVFDRPSELFSGIWTHAHDDFIPFYERYLADVERYNGTGKLFPKTPIPENLLSISMIPWTSFTGFNLNVTNNPTHLLPIITAGGFVHKDGLMYLPLSFQIHHAVCDGYHAGLFMNRVQELAERSGEWLL